MESGNTLMGRAVRTGHVPAATIWSLLLVACGRPTCASEGRLERDAGWLDQASAQAGTEVTPGNLIVFVGKRLDLRRVTPTSGGLIAFDKKFEARYQVLSVIFGTYREPEIRFTAYDHKTQGDPGFARHDIVLLYVSRYKDEIIHQKYQYHVVFPTRDGKWAGCGDPYEDESGMHRGDLQARPIQFLPEVAFDLRGLNEDEIRQQYPPQYYEIRGDIAICRAGAYAADLFEVKKRGVLKARGLFH